RGEWGGGGGGRPIFVGRGGGRPSPPAVIHPCLLLACVEAESEPGIERDRGVLTDIERGERVAALDGAVLRRIPDLQRRHDFPASEALDLEFPIGQLPHALTHGFDTAVKRIEALRPARCQPPTHWGAGLSDRRPRNRGRSHARARSHEKRTPLHFGSPAEM